MIGKPLGDRQEVVVVVAKYGAARKQSHFGHRGEARDGARHPGHRACASDRAVGRRIRGDGGDVALRQEAAAEFVLLVGEDDARACIAGGERRGETCRATADDEHVAMGVHLVVAVRVGLGRRRSRPAPLRM
jgi:hypothetical protein